MRGPLTKGVRAERVKPRVAKRSRGGAEASRQIGIATREWCRWQCSAHGRERIGAAKFRSNGRSADAQASADSANDAHILALGGAVLWWVMRS